MAEIRHFSSRGLAYERRGAGSPVLLLHGWCLCGRLWTYTENALADAFDVLVPDQAGFGHSSSLAGPYALERYANDALDLLNELELDDVVVVGFAFGGAVAMTMATTDSSRLKAIVPIGIPSGELFPADRLTNLMQRDWPEYCRRSARAVCKQDHSEATFRWLEDMFRDTRLPVAIETAHLLRAFEPDPIAPDVRVPALYVHGDRDDVSPVAVAERCRDLSPEGELAVIEDSGHLAVIDQPSRFHGVLQDFLER